MTLHWIPGERKNQVRPHFTWSDAVWRDIELMDITWKGVCIKTMEDVDCVEPLPSKTQKQQITLTLSNSWLVPGNGLLHSLLH